MMQKQQTFGRIFITGIESFVGQVLRKRCRDQGIKVSGIDLRVDDADTTIRCDINDPGVADHIDLNTDALVHLAALSRDSDCTGKPAECFRINVAGTMNMAQAAAKAGVRRFVFASSEWVYPDAAGETPVTEDTRIDPLALTSEYALSKLMAEYGLSQYSRNNQLSLAILRFGIIYGERMTNWGAVESLLASVARPEDISVGSLATARRYLHVSDVADAIIAACKSPVEGVLNIQGPELTSLGDIVSAAQEILGSSIATTEKNPAAPSIRSLSSRKAEIDLGWKATVQYREGLIRLADYFGYGAN